jgi:hypothetical protein
MFNTRREIIYLTKKLISFKETMGSAPLLVLEKNVGISLLIKIGLSYGAIWILIICAMEYGIKLVDVDSLLHYLIYVAIELNCISHENRFFGYTYCTPLQRIITIGFFRLSWVQNIKLFSFTHNGFSSDRFLQ